MRNFGKFANKHRWRRRWTQVTTDDVFNKRIICPPIYFDLVLPVYLWSECRSRGLGWPSVKHFIQSSSNNWLIHLNFRFCLFAFRKTSSTSLFEIFSYLCNTNTHMRNNPGKRNICEKYFWFSSKLIAWWKRQTNIFEANFIGAGEEKVHEWNLLSRKWWRISSIQQHILNFMRSDDAIMARCWTVSEYSFSRWCVVVVVMITFHAPISMENLSNIFPWFATPVWMETAGNDCGGGF